jgi:hypothetical protein
MSGEFKAAPPRKSYGNRPATGSAIPGGPSSEEVWLRGNVRPVIGGAAVAAAFAGLVALGAGLTLGPAWAVRVATSAALVIVPAALLLALAAGRPRLVRCGGVLRVRLAPLNVQELPLEVVECVFPGSRPLPAVGSDSENSTPSRRVSTLILRLAERATQWRQRPSFTAWGAWDDGHVIIDGRWCEQLSPELARRIGTRLAELRRRPAAGDCSESAGQST